MKKLVDLCHIQYGYAFDSKCFTEINTFPQLVRIRDVKRGYSETFYLGDYPDEYVLSAGDLLIGMDGEFNIARWKVDGALLNQRVCKITAKEGINEEYIRFFLLKCLKKIEGRTSFVTVKHLSAKELNKIEIDVPEFAEQETIASLLSKLEKIIELKNKELQQLDGLIKARFVEMFGDPENNPKGWVENPLSEKLNVLGGYAFKSDQFDEINGIPVLRIGNINCGYFKPVNMVYWKADRSLERYAMYPGDLVMSLTGTVGKDDYGNVCILGNDYEMYYLNQRNAKLELRDGLDKYYLAELLKFPQVKKKLTGISRGVRQANISNKDILNLVVPIPPMELQKQFATFVVEVNKSKVVKGFDSLSQQNETILLYISNLRHTVPCIEQLTLSFFNTYNKNEIFT